METQSG